MTPLIIAENSFLNWTKYADEIGFVPDPMILRAGEIFLNGRSGSLKLGRTDSEVWSSLAANMGGIVDFFDMIVTRDTIPLIGYYATFMKQTVELPLDSILGEQTRVIDISLDVYESIKKGALVSLSEVDFSQLTDLSNALVEQEILRYDWKPDIFESADGPLAAKLHEKLSVLEQAPLEVAQFLLSGFIFSGFAQASSTTHYIQPKRARLFLGLTATPDLAKRCTADEETTIFDATEARLQGREVAMKRSYPIPPVLPFLLSGDQAPGNVQELLEHAKNFRESAPGRAYRELAATLRADGVNARRAEDLISEEGRRAMDMLAPYSRLKPSESGSLEIKFPGALMGVPGVDISATVRPPVWLRVWWNDNIPFQSVLRKTLRRMWMDAASYDALDKKLRSLWAAS
ncbi:hypothetical protein [Burkholderia sp. S171]|uniref:hypothetical protein n=1 Tax=Burkholderia sp. S171 TaxID=1641860 RepID=UPI00131CCC59|nr:hypothetical protein [Burkholderia sp. S171]